MKKLKPEIRQLYDREVVDAVLFEEWLGRKGWAWQQIDRGEIAGLSLDVIKFLYVCEDPIRWCYTYLDDPRKPGTPYTLWDYQIPSARAWHQDTIHQCGAETGKTREIIGLVAWSSCTAFGFSREAPSSLIAAPAQTHLDEIIMALENLAGASEGFRGRKPVFSQYWLKPKKHPHYMARFLAPNLLSPENPVVCPVYFRPMGHDGDALRGVHVTGFGMVDEAAKVAAPVCWSEFWRALEPEAASRIYSVPDGRRGTDYYEMTTTAVPNLKVEDKGRRLFYWPKTLMPAPFWDEDRRRKYITLYHGVDSSGYTRNVMGLHGQPEDTVFPTATYMPNVRNIPEYRAIKIICEPAAGVLHLEVYRVELEITSEGHKVPHTHYLAERQMDLDDFIDARDWEKVRRNVRDLLREFIDPPTGIGEYYMGCDLGQQIDPSEFFLYSRTGENLRRTIRVHLKGADYALQCEIIYCLDQLFGFGERITRIGIDLGAAGIAVVQTLQANKGEIYAGSDYDERIFGVQFKTKTDAIDEDGNLVLQEDKDGKEKAVRKSFKHLSTDLMIRRYQKHRFDVPYDNEVVQHFLGHTATKSKSGDDPIYEAKNDHTIDAERTAMMAMVLGEDGFVEVPLSTGAMGR